MPIRYDSEIQEKICCGKKVFIENITPQFCAEDEKNVKKSVENQLYDVFSKYYINKP